MNDRPRTLDHLVEPLLVGEPRRITKLARDDGWDVARSDFRHGETAACSEKVVFADFGKSADLPTGETVAVEFLPEKPGADAFDCRMGMPRGKLMVR